MIRPFGLRNSLQLHSLSQRSTLLQVERELLSPQAPLWAAIGAPLPWHGSGAATYLLLPRAVAVESAGQVVGFVQAIKRRGRAEADLTRIAPRLSGPRATDARGPDTWRQLLTHLIQSAADHGIQRLYSCLPNDDESAIETVIAAGFAPYIQETLFILPAAPLAPTPAAWSHVRPHTEADSVALQRLLGRCTPPLVQQAEGLLVGEGPFAREESSPLDVRSWWQPEQAEIFVYEDRSEVIAAVQMRRGRRGHWLRLVCDPQAAPVLSELLAYTLHVLSRGNARPIYCPLRPYQSSFGPLLTAHNFYPDATLTRLVKHTTSFARRLAPSPLTERLDNALPGLAPSESRRLPAANRRRSGFRN